MQILMAQHPSQLQTRFFSGIIPENWIERIYDYQGYYFVYVTGDKVSEEYFENLKLRFVNEFGDNLQHIYEHPSNGIAFEVYLKKSDRTE